MFAVARDCERLCRRERFAVSFSSFPGRRLFAFDGPASSYGTCLRTTTGDDVGVCANKIRNGRLNIFIKLNQHLKKTTSTL
jgi:hypothetical protein